MKLGATFLLHDENEILEHAKPHLHIVITVPDRDGVVVLVSVTTRRAKSDTMVCLNPGDHEFISHPSVITYAYSKLTTCTRLKELTASGEAVSKADASEDLLRRVRAGMLETDRAPEEVKHFFREQQDATT